MSLSTHQLREEVKTHFDHLILWAQEKEALGEVIERVKQWKHKTHHAIQSKLKVLEQEFNEQTLYGDYVHSVTQGFDTIERLIQYGDTLLDFTQAIDVQQIVHKVKSHYVQTLIPLFNILSELENDYIGLTKQALRDKQEALTHLNHELTALKEEEKSLKEKLFVLNKKGKLSEITEKIRIIELKRKITQLTLHHDKLNLYYFNNHEPPELLEIKQKADALRLTLLKATENLYEQ